jgi:hypothetical protein
MPPSEPDRVYRGTITHLGYDLEDKRARVDVEGNVNESGRGQLYFESAAHGGPGTAERLDQMLHLAFVNGIRVEVWVHINDELGRQNVIHTVNFSKT